MVPQSGIHGVVFIHAVLLLSLAQSAKDCASPLIPDEFEEYSCASSAGGPSGPLSHSLAMMSARKAVVRSTSSVLPERNDDLESAEVKEQDESQHCGPPAQKGFSLRNGSRHDPEQNRAEDRFDDRPQPTSWQWRRYALTRIQESLGIHSRPTQKVGY